jgi:hypothetical protein
MENPICAQNLKWKKCKPENAEMQQTIPSQRDILKVKEINYFLFFLSIL